MRLFVAIPLAAEVTDALQRLVRKLQSGEDGLRWSAPESWHITLRFLGETSAETYVRLVARLMDVKSPVIPVRLDGTGFFKRSGVFFAGVNVSQEMLGLEKRVQAATSLCEFVAEDRPFHPHVTLARANGDNRRTVLRRLKLRENDKARFPAFTATEFVLYEAFLGAGGSRYAVLERFRLGNT